MTKYNLVLYHEGYKEFLEALRECGLVDITTTGWEPTEGQRALLAGLDEHRQVMARLSQLAQEELGAVAKFDTPAEAYESYVEAAARIEPLTVLLQNCNKEVREIEVWGDFDPALIDTLAREGIRLGLFSIPEREFKKNADVWREKYTVEAINTVDGQTYFAVVTTDSVPMDIEAQDIKVPVFSYKAKLAEIAQIERDLEAQNLILKRCAASLGLVRQYGAGIANRIHFERVADSGKSAADGSLILLEGWATSESEPDVDAFLESHSDMVYYKEAPTPDDDAPVMLKNNRFARLFEFIGNFYSLPKYGTPDLTAYFAPFYMIFFGFCLGEAGYGLVLLLGGLYLALKGEGAMRSIGKLTMCCGASGMVFGLLAGSFFGVQMAELPMFSSIRDKFLGPDFLFNLAIIVGVINLLYGMGVKVVMTASRFGFKYTFDTLGWMIVLISGISAAALPSAGVNYTMDSIPFYVITGAGLFMMFFLNSPGKNPLINFGSGLWNLYNYIVSFLGDTLSYIRLFAVGLSGGILAMVFNDLAAGFTADLPPVLRQLAMLVILLIGHGVNIFMSALGSFVHPMRLTFVEFYKNAGFEAGMRAFTPFKKIENS